MTYRLAFTEDPAEFLSTASELLAAEPVVSTVIATFAERRRASGPRGSPRRSTRCWWVTVHEDDRVVGVAMRTAPFEPHPMFVLPMPDEARGRIADAVAARGEEVVASNGALPAAEVLARTLARTAAGPPRSTSTPGCTCSASWSSRRARPAVSGPRPRPTPS